MTDDPAVGRDLVSQPESRKHALRATENTGPRTVPVYALAVQPRQSAAGWSRPPAVLDWGTVVTPGPSLIEQLRAYQSAWTSVPLCSVATVALPLHSTSAPRSPHVSVACFQCSATPAGDS